MDQHAAGPSKKASVVMPPVDPRDQLRLTVFDIFSETNSLYKQVLTTAGGQRGARIALRRIELSLAQADELTKKMRQLIKYYEEVDHTND